MPTLDQYRATAARLTADHAHATRRAREEAQALQKATADHEAALAARTYLQECAEAVQERAHRHFAAIASRCLEAVFGDSAYALRFEFSQRRGRTEARPLLVRGGPELVPEDATGGGVIDVAAFSLRLACLTLTVPPPRRLLVLDEPFKMLSRNHHGRVRRLLEDLSTEMDLQIIMATHAKGLVTGKVVDLGEG